jgi:hypothetical protein
MPNKRRSSKKHSKKRSRSRKHQKGGNYHLGVERPRIGGLAEVVRVDDPIPPTALASKDSFPVPLYLQQKGGKRKSSKLRKFLLKYFSSKGKRRSHRRSHKGQRGGAEGLPSVFDGNMLNRDFSCKQPDWAPRCI